MTLAEQVGANIEAARKKRKLSLQKVAARVTPKTSYQHIARLEKGGSALNFEWVEKIADALGVDPFELIAPGRAREPTAPRLSEQAAVEFARTLAVAVLADPEPDEGIVQIAALALQGIFQTFAEDPEAATDAKMARLAANLLGRQYAPVAN